MSEPAVVWTPEGPRSARFGDVYFSREDGLAESRAVFLAGCGLPDAWAGRELFTVAELGFGTGLNIAALLQLWRETRSPGARLQIFSVEAFPLSREEAARALEPWPDLSPVVTPLLAAWASTPGFHRIDLPDAGACLDLAIGEVGEMLRGWSGPADAWFLDGFAPAANPDMWRDEVMALIAERSAYGARVATFTVAGQVRRSLASHGFEVAKRPGFGRKRERLEARLPGCASDPEPPRMVAVIGAGVAGAAVVRALRALGASPVLVDSTRPGAGASGNPSALVTPRFDAGGGDIADLSAQAFGRAVDLYAATTPDAILARGVLQLESQDRDATRFDRIAEQAIWPAGSVQRLNTEAAASRLGEPTSRGGLWLADALVVEPSAVLSAWIGDAPVIAAEVAAARRTDDGWSVHDKDERVIVTTDVVILAAGPGLAALDAALGVSPVRGQVSFSQGERQPAAAWGGYVAPTRDGFLFGSTHDRSDVGTDVRVDDSDRNLGLLRQARPQLADALEAVALEARASVRAAMPDRLPLCGQIEPGLYVLGGLGSRGFSFAPLLAEHLAAEIAGAPSPLPRHLAARLSPNRFARRHGE